MRIEITNNTTTSGLKKMLMETKGDIAILIDASLTKGRYIELSEVIIDHGEKVSLEIDWTCKCCKFDS